MLETHGKREGPSKGVEDLKKNQMGISRLKTAATKMQNAFDGLNSNVKRTGERVGELDARAMGTSRSEQQREPGLGKQVDRAPGSCGAGTDCLACVSPEGQRGGPRRRG